MRHFMATRFTSSEQESFDNVIEALKPDPAVVLQWSVDTRAEGKGDTTATVYFLADGMEEDRLAGIMWGWHVRAQERVKTAPDNNAPLVHLRDRPGFTDYRVRQPEIHAGMSPYMLSAAKDGPGVSFNQAAAVLLKEPVVRLAYWRDLTGEDGFKVSGVFHVLAANYKDAVTVAKKLPGWEITPSHNAGPASRAKSPAP